MDTLEEAGPTGQAASSGRRIRFGSFPQGRWRIAWLGDVSFHDRHITQTQPTIAVVLESYNSFTRGTLLEIFVPIAQLFALKLGSIWQDKVLVEERLQSTEELSVGFNVNDAMSCASGVLLDTHEGNGFLLPFNEHRFHKHHTMSWCLRVQAGPWLLIFPTIELIRFYFGSSGELLKRLFSANYSHQLLADESEMRLGRQARVVLPSGVPAASAPDIARIIFDPAASKAATLISQSIISGRTAITTDNKTYAKCTFPFSQRAHLNIIGTPIPSTDSTKRFLVEEIKSCAARFPFQSLQYVSSQKTGRPSRGDSGGSFEPTQSSGAGNASRPSYSTRSPSDIENTEPKKNSSIKRVGIGSDVRFPDLLGKKSFRVDGQAPKPVEIRALAARPFGGTGDGVASGRGSKMEPIIDVDARERLPLLKPPIPEWASYFRLLAKIAAQPWVTSMSFVRLDARQVHSHYSSLPQLIDEDGVVLEDTLPMTVMRREKPVTVPRYASLVNIGAGARTSGLIALCPTSASPHNRIVLWPDTPISQENALHGVAQLCMRIEATTGGIVIPLLLTNTVSGALHAEEALPLITQYASL